MDTTPKAHKKYVELIRKMSPDSALPRRLNSSNLPGQ